MSAATKSPIPVLVTGVGGGGHGEQILKALRLAPTRYEIVGTDVSPASKGLAEVDHPYLVPPASDRTFIDCILALARKHGVKALFHGSEPELKAMSRNRARFAEAGIFLPLNPEPVVETCMDKSRTMAALAELGFRAPRTVTVRAAEDMEAIPFLPVVLKPSVGGGGSANTLLAQTRDELRAFCHHLLGIYNEFIVQEYVGTPDHEYTVGVLLSMDGELLNSIAMRRWILSALSSRIKVPNRTGNAALGPTLAISSGVSQGEIGPFPEVTGPCERLAVALGCRAAVNVQCRYVEGEVYIFEINPRFSGTTSIRAMVGYNEPDVLIRKHVLGETITPRFPYRSGMVVRGLAETLLEVRAIPHARELL